MAAPVGGYIRETSDEVIIDSDGRDAEHGSMRVRARPAIMLKGKRDQVELWVARAKALVGSPVASAPLAG